MHDLVKECNQNCEGVGLKMDGDQDTTSTPRKDPKTGGVDTIINFMQLQMKTSECSLMW